MLRFLNLTVGGHALTIHPNFFEKIMIPLLFPFTSLISFILQKNLAENLQFAIRANMLLSTFYNSIPVLNEI